MCGIAGAIGPDADLLTRRMTAALVHRGPDDDGHFRADGVALGFRRLSIIDVEGGAQPMANETGEITLVCNGEIYNSPELRRHLQAAGHQFRTLSDVEVIPHLYEEHGEDCARHLRGMFAFAIWDAREGTLLPGKDHMGQKPLFFHRDGERFLFASEIQALLASGKVPRVMDVNSLWHYLSLRSMPDECSVISGIHKLPAATTLLRDANGSLRTRRYWTPDFRAKLKLREDEAVDALDGVLREAVASQVARAEGMVFHGERVHADIASLLPFMAHHLGEPADPYAVGIYLVSRLASRRYVGQRLVDYYCLLPAALRRGVMPRLIKLIPETFQYKSLAQRLAWLHSMSGLQGGERYARALGVLRFTLEERDELFEPEVIRSLKDADTVDKVLRYFDAPNVESLTDRMLYTDLMIRVPDHNLVMGDRMSMACSLEVRSPFVDPRVVEFAASLPATMKVRGRRLKYLLRRLAARYLPDEIVRRPKQGFGFPVGIWMRRNLSRLVDARLRDSRLVAAGVFRAEPIERLLRAHMDGQADHSYRLWLLLNLEIWYDVHIEGRGMDAARDDIVKLARPVNA